MLPCSLFEDDHLLVVNKPAGWNTHAPAPYAVEGIYDWLRHREPRWANLAILHRLDKDTSGVLVLGKTRLANQSLTRQFTERRVHKEYRLVTDRPVAFRELTVRSLLTRSGEVYLPCPAGADADAAVTRFRVVRSAPERTELLAEPLTGQTHQIRAHAAWKGFPILGDRLYGGTPTSRGARPGRLWLHAAVLSFRHPATGAPMRWEAPVDFEAFHPLDLRRAMLDFAETDAFRVVHGAADGWPGRYLDRLGDYWLVQIDPLRVREAGKESNDTRRPDVRGAHEPGCIPLTRPAAAGHPLPLRGGEGRGEGDGCMESAAEAWRTELEMLARRAGATGVYEQTLERRLRGRGTSELSPRRVLGEPAPPAFTVRENGIRFELALGEGYSIGLFLDQRDNRRRLRANHIAADFPVVAGGLAGCEVLNTFAYTCGFSVCAALAGARTTSVDLSRKALERGRRNFLANGLTPEAHAFLAGEVFEWLDRFARKQRRFDVVIIDPPTFSQSKRRGTFRVERDYEALVREGLRVLRPGGVLLACTNYEGWKPEALVRTIEAAVSGVSRPILQQHFATQPPDFPATREEPLHLKSLWVRVG